MLDFKNKNVYERIFEGHFGLEKESLRVTEDGTFAQTLHPFHGMDHITRDFSENLIEINTPVCDSAEEAIEELKSYTLKIQKALANMNPREYLWLNSNPPYIEKEKDIPIAVYGQEEMDKRIYREYLAVRYGRYRMAFSGIHVNYSFSEDLIKAGFAASGFMDFREYKDRLYLKLAENLASYGWIVTAVTAASADMDGSFFERRKKGKTTFLGMASVRCSELGYWNMFTPVFDYTSLSSYAKSISRYVENGFISFPSELYYPIRLKPCGENKLENLAEGGVDHIELRNVDLNPMSCSGLDLRDLKFIQYLLIWAVNTPRTALSEADQIQVAQNFKNAARYDLKTVNIVYKNGEFDTVAKAGQKLIGRMKDFYSVNLNSEDDRYREVMDILDFEEKKFTDPDTRYAAILHQHCSELFFEKNLEFAKQIQERIVFPDKKMT